MNEKDKKEFRLIMGEVLEQVVLPRIQDVENKVDKGFEEVDERFNDVNASLNRVETLAKSEIKYVDDLSKRVVVLETKRLKEL